MMFNSGNRIVLLFSLAALCFAPFIALAQNAPTIPVASPTIPTAQPANDPAKVQKNGALPLGSTASAASSAILPPEVVILKKIEEELKDKYKNQIYDPPAIKSLFFTPSQQALLREAGNGFNSRASTVAAQTEAKDNKDNAGEEPPLSIDAPRSVSLSGIVFLSPDDWTIWLNKKRVTPANMPSEAIDLRVYREFIEMKWYDAATNQIFPIRLRPNQTFNLDGKVFIPG